MKRALLVSIKGIVGLVITIIIGVLFFHLLAEFFGMRVLVLFPFILAFGVSGLVIGIIHAMKPSTPPVSQGIGKPDRYMHKVLGVTIVVFLVLLAWLVYTFNR